MKQLVTKRSYKIGLSAMALVLLMTTAVVPLHMQVRVPIVSKLEVMPKCIGCWKLRRGLLHRGA